MAMSYRVIKTEAKKDVVEVNIKFEGKALTDVRPTKGLPIGTIYKNIKSNTGCWNPVVIKKHLPGKDLPVCIRISEDQKIEFHDEFIKISKVWNSELLVNKFLPYYLFNNNINYVENRNSLIGIAKKWLQYDRNCYKEMNDLQLFVDTIDESNCIGYYQDAKEKLYTEYTDGQLIQIRKNMKDLNRYLRPTNDSKKVLFLLTALKFGDQLKTNIVFDQTSTATSAIEDKRTEEVREYEKLSVADLLAGKTLGIEIVHDRTKDFNKNFDISDCRTNSPVFDDKYINIVTDGIKFKLPYIIEDATGLQDCNISDKVAGILEELYEVKVNKIEGTDQIDYVLELYPDAPKSFMVEGTTFTFEVDMVNELFAPFGNFEKEERDLDEERSSFIKYNNPSYKYEKMLLAAESLDEFDDLISTNI